MSRVVFEGVEKRFETTTVLPSLDLEVRDGEFLTLLGPSGCGKTTTLRLIAGFISPTKGTIRIGDQDVTNLPPQNRQLGMVFQDYALFPHLTVAENIAFGLVERRVPKQTIKPRVEELMKMVELQGAEERYPAQLSGGQRQRVAIARAIAYPPRVLLMDEPLGALDLKLRETMQIELRRIQQQLRITLVYVTHDQVEAMTMSDRIVVMNAGVPEQIDTPVKIYRLPKSRFVADFIGQINLLQGNVLAEEKAHLVIECPLGTKLHVLKREGVDAGKLAYLGIRPENLLLRPAGFESSDSSCVVKGVVRSNQFNGSVVRVLVDLADGLQFTVEEKASIMPFKVGDQVAVTWSPDDVVLLRK